MARSGRYGADHRQLRHGTPPPPPPPPSSFLLKEDGATGLVDTIGRNACTIDTVIADPVELASAVTGLRAGIEERKARFGHSHPAVAELMNNLAALLQKQGNMEDAKVLYRGTLEVVERAHGESHPHTALTLNNLASLLREEGRLDEAEPLFERALRIRSQLHGEDHPSYVTVLNNLAVLQEERGHFDAACEMYSCALQPVMKHYGMNHPHVAAILNNIAVVKRKQGKLEEADPFQLQALTIGMAALKVGHPSLLIWRHNLDVLYELKAMRDEKKLAEERMRLAQKQQDDDERLRLDEEKWIREEEQQREWQQRTKKRKRQNSGPPLPKSKGPNSKSHNSKSQKRAKPSVVDKERRKKKTRKVNKWSPSDDARKTGTWQDYEHAAFVRAIESRIGGPVVSLAKQLWNKKTCTSKFFDGGTIDDAWNVIARLVGTRSCEQCQTYCRKGFAAIFDSGAYTRDHALRTKGKKNSRKKTSALERKKVPNKIKCVVPIDAAAVSNNPKKRHVLGPSSPPIDLNKGKEKGPQDGVE